jgi:NAD+ synthase (glutamine-hydrolysing)
MQEGERRYNALSWIRDGDVLVRYRKQALPNYTVFDEKRYFAAGDQAATVELDGVRFAPLICEDIWDPQPAQPCALQVGADAFLVINASPFNPRKTRRSPRGGPLGARASTTCRWPT